MFSPSNCREEQLNLLPPVSTVRFISNDIQYHMYLHVYIQCHLVFIILFSSSPSFPSTLSLTLSVFFRHFNISLSTQLSMFSTPTTPTITPTLKNIEVEAAHDEDPFGVQPLLHNHQGGFVPPTVDIAVALRSTHSSSSIGQENMSSNSNFCPSRHSNDDDESSVDSDCLSTSIFSQGSQSNDSHATIKEFTSTRGSKNTSTRARSTGNNSNRSTRKTSNNTRETPEEERKKKIRRERNKQAAARCRKRRLDHTNELTKQTELLDKQKAGLEQEFEQKRKEYEKYKSFLEEHKNSNECRCKSDNYMQSSVSTAVAAITSTAATTTTTSTTATANKVCRPSSLALPVSCSSSSLPVDPLVSASTPSSGIPISALLDCTGLTPLLTTPSAGGFMPGIPCTSTSTRLPPDETAQSSNEPTTPSKLVSL